MSDTPTQPLSAFEQLLATYSSNPAAPLPLPADVAAQCAILDAAKLFIVDALYRSAVAAAQQAVDLAWVMARQTGVDEQNALAHWCSGLFFANRNVRQALFHLETARAYYHRTQKYTEEARTLFGCASQLNLLGRLDEAEAAIHQAMAGLVATPDYRDWPGLYLNLAYIQGQRGYYAQMLTSAEQAEALALRFAAKHPARATYYGLLQAQAQINQGYAALLLADFARAADKLQAAQQLATRYDSAEVRARATLNLARLETLRGHLFTALRLLHQAREDFTTAQIDLDQATVALEEAALYVRLMMPQRAQHAALLAAAAFEQAGIVAEGVEARLLAVWIALTLHEPQKATHLLTQVQPWLDRAPPVLQALAQAYTAHPAQQRTPAAREAAAQQVAQAGTQLAALGAQREALDAALIAAELAQALKQRDVAARYSQIMEQARRQGLDAVERQACVGLAQQQRPQAAALTLRRAADLIATERQQMPAEELKAHLLGGHAAVYTQLIETQLRLHDTTDALQTLLEAKGGLWTDVAAPVGPAPPNPAWVQAKLTLSYWQEELRSSAEAAYRTLCQQKIAAAEGELATTARLQTRERHPTPLPTPAQVVAALPPTSVLLEYLMGSVDLCCAVLTPGNDQPQWVRLGKRTAVQTLLARFNLLVASLRHGQDAAARADVAQAQEPALVALLQQLYNLLMAPLLEKLATLPTPPELLVIAPDDFLFELPWFALHDGRGYLNERYQLLLTPSGVLLANRATAVPPAPAVTPLGEQPALVLGNAGEPPLRYLEQEIAAVARALPGAQVVNPATAHALAWPTPPPLLHVAAHGRIHRRAPLLSALELADGPYLLADVLNLALHGTRLVTLSGCDTGATPEQGGVLLALAGAFLAAGAQSVLASLWPVDDQATQILMEHLYTHLQRGTTLAAALQQAQRQLIHAGYTHPYYWAAFQPLVARIDKLTG